MSPTQVLVIRGQRLYQSHYGASSGTALIIRVAHGGVPVRFDVP
jgi:hypothetical protein